MLGVFHQHYRPVYRVYEVVMPPRAVAYVLR